MNRHLLLLFVALCANGCQTRDSAIQEASSDIDSTKAEVATAESSDAMSQPNRGAVLKIEEVAENYQDLRLITPEPVFVDPMISTYCRILTEEEVTAAHEQLGPHVDSAVKIYMNDPAAAAFAAGSTAYPVGSVIVKEKLLLGDRDMFGEWVARGNGVGGMVKRTAGFDSDHGDWEYFYLESPDDLEQGRIDSCIQCHQSAKLTDYVFGSWQFRPEFSEDVKADDQAYGPSVLLNY